MLSLGLISYEMDLGFSDIFTSYEMELETYVHVHIENQIGFHEHQIACYQHPGPFPILGHPMTNTL